MSRYSTTGTSCTINRQRANFIVVRRHDNNNHDELGLLAVRSVVAVAGSLTLTPACRYA